MGEALIWPRGALLGEAAAHGTAVWGRRFGLSCRQALLVPRSSLRIQTEVRHTQENKNRRTGSKQAAGRGFLRPDAGAATSSPTAYHVNIAKLSTSFSNGKTAIISACPAPRLCGEPVMSPLSAMRAGPASSEPSCAHQKSNHVLDGGRHLPKSSPTGDRRPETRDGD